MGHAMVDNFHIAIIASPGMGHLIPVLVLAYRLAVVHGVRVTILHITAATSPSESKFVSLPLTKDMVEIMEIPPVDISHLVDDATKVITQLHLMTRAVMPSIRSAISALAPRPAALFVDLFTTEALAIAAELDMPKYMYIASTAWFTALTVYSSVLDKEIQGEYVDLPGPLRIPGCRAVRPDDLVDPMLDRTDQQYHEYIKMATEIPLSDGILLNTWEDLEPNTLQALKSLLKNPVYPIGPLRRPVEQSRSTSKLFRWLDRLPNASVIYVSFGSGGMLSAEQITELAWGLELSKQRFVWVVRPPTAGSIDGAFFSTRAASNDTPLYLPDGFSTRTRGVGMLIQGWAEQVEILNHPSVGGFVSHCGWNSTLESITSGVPMIAWPLYAEQRMNAALLVEELAVAVAVGPRELPTKGVVGREEIEKLVRLVIQEKEGREMKARMEQLKTSIQNALSETGSSYKSMCELLSKIGSKKPAMDV